MNQPIKEKEIGDIVSTILNNYSMGKHIDAVDIYNQPNKKEVIDLVENLFSIVFPGYYKNRDVKIYNPENCFAVTIENCFYHLNKLINIALDFGPLTNSMSEVSRREESYHICKEFFKKIPVIRDYIEEDLLAIYNGDPAAKCLDEIILAYPGLMAITTNRLAHELYLLDVPLLPRLMTEYAHSKTGIDIHPGATIGKRFFIDHGTGIVIGETSVIGNSVKIYQSVTIGALSTSGGHTLSNKKRHPTIKDNVTIYAGASILGGDTVIGENSIIGANAFITKSVPAGSKISIIGCNS